MEKPAKVGFVILRFWGLILPNRQLPASANIQNGAVTARDSADRFSDSLIVSPQTAKIAKLFHYPGARAT